MKKYLITGGCGFIGSHLADALVGTGHEVVILDNLSSGKVENAPPEARVIFGDVTDMAQVERAFVGINGCFHLAAIPSVELSRKDWQMTHNVNQSATINILKAASDAGGVPVVYASSAAVYGEASKLPLTEKSPTNPISAYGVDKLGSEMHARVAAGIHNVPNVGLRFFNVYGPRQNPSSMYCGVISKFIQRIKAGLSLEIYGDGEQSRDFTYVGDVVAACQAAMDYARNMGEAEAEVLNICTGRSTTLNQLAEALEKIYGRKVGRNHLEARAGDIRASLGSADKAAIMLGLSSLTPLSIGLEATIGCVAEAA